MVADVSTFDPARLSMARDLAGWTKVELATAIGRSVSTVSQYEHGQSTPDLGTLERCAKALRLLPEFFTSGRPRLRLDTNNVHFRSVRSATAAERRQSMAKVELLWELINQVDQVVELPEVSIGLPVGLRHGDPVTTARAVRTAWNQTCGPVVHLVRQLESRGVVVVHLTAGERIDGFSAALLGRPVIVLTLNGNALRHRFSAAHELGHLLLHPDPAPGNSRHEAEANAFAGEFLMPAAEIADQLPVDADLVQLKELADGYGVSAAALLQRGKTLGVYQDATVRNTIVRLSRLGWRTREPVRSDFPGERPELLVQAVDMASRLGLPLPRLASRLCVSPSMLRELIGMPNSKPLLRVV